MTAMLTPAPASPAISREHRFRVTQARVVLSEWTKFRSLRSTVYTLLAAVVLMIGLGALLSAFAAGQPNGLDAGATAISTSLTGTVFAQLAIGVLGVLLITGEYSTGMIRASLAVAPARLRSIVGAALYLTVAAITALALGALLRNTATAISTFVAVFFVIPPLAPLLPASWSGISSSTCHPTPAR